MIKKSLPRLVRGARQKWHGPHQVPGSLTGRAKKFRENAQNTRKAQYSDVRSAYQLALWLVSAKDKTVADFGKEFELKISKKTDLIGIAANVVFEGMERQRISERAQAMRWLCAKKVSPNKVERKIVLAGGIRGASERYAALTSGKVKEEKPKFSLQTLKEHFEEVECKFTKTPWPKSLKNGKGSIKTSKWGVFIGRKTLKGNIKIFLPTRVTEAILKKTLEAYPKQEKKEPPRKKKSPTAPLAIKRLGDGVVVKSKW